MKIVSWNIAGRSSLILSECGELTDLIRNEDPDIICLQETKLDNQSIKGLLTEYYDKTNKFYHVISNGNKGYSGVATLVKPDITVTGDIIPNLTAHRLDVGRGQIFNINGLYLVNIYVPNSGTGLVRKEFKIHWMRLLTDYLMKIKNHVVRHGGNFELVLVGDLNVASSSIELARPNENWNKTPGYTDYEIDEYKRFCETLGLVDSFRYLHPDVTGKYSFFSSRCKTNRERNVGWRLDYALVTNQEKIAKSDILNNYIQSDHCPIILEYND